MNWNTSGRAVPPPGSGAEPSVGSAERNTRPSWNAAIGDGSRVRPSSSRTRSQPWEAALEQHSATVVQRLRVGDGFQPAGEHLVGEAFHRNPK